MKIWNYVVISTFLALIFVIAGFEIPGVNYILGKTGISTTGAAITDSLIYLSILGTAGILIGLGFGIAIGFVTKSQPENFIILPFIIGELLIFAGTFTGIIIAAFNEAQWIGLIVSLILSPLLVGFLIATYEHFRGTD